MGEPPVLFICLQNPLLLWHINPIDTGLFFDACVPGVGEKTPPPENQLLRNKNTFSLHEVKFCINLA